MEHPSAQDCSANLQRCTCEHPAHAGCSAYRPKSDTDANCYHRRDWGGGFFYCDWRAAPS